jgi:protein-L-isoaspartate(D-aspartate) O-methyltransferase
MLAIRREDFCWPGTEAEAYADSPLPLGGTGQTISAPHMVAMMLEALKLRPGDRVLEVGAGSGYNAACMTHMVGKKGKVLSVELRPDLAEFARKNVKRAGCVDVLQVMQGDGSRGWPQGVSAELYDRITLTAATRNVAMELVAQVRIGGIILAPLGDHWVQLLTRLVKGKDGLMEREVLCECVFVPLLTP